VLTPRDLGWGNPYDLTGSDMVRCDIGAYVGQPRSVYLRNTDVGVLAAELVRRLVAAGWPGPAANPAGTLDDWGYNGRLKRWAQNAGQRWGSAPMSSVSDHAWGTGLDLNTIPNPMLDRRPADPWAHHDLPRATPEIAAQLGFDWGGNWTEPFDPQHFGLTITPAEAARRAATIRAARSAPAAETGDAMTPDQAKLALDILQGLARAVPPLAQRVADVERRQLAINTQEQTRDAAQDAELAAVRDDLAKLLELGQAPAPTPTA
jgi:hypothetical protein